MSLFTTHTSDDIYPSVMPLSLEFFCQFWYLYRSAELLYVQYQVTALIYYE